MRNFVIGFMGWLRRPKAATSYRHPRITAALGELENAIERYRAEVDAVQAGCPHQHVMVTKTGSTPRYARLCLQCGLEELLNRSDSSHVYWRDDTKRRLPRLTAEFVKQGGFDEYMTARLP